MRQSFTTLRWWTTAIAAAVLLGACATQLPTLPALSTSGSHQPGKVVWHDLITPDLTASRAFYGSLFGWTFDEVSSGYVLVRNQSRMIGGMASLDSPQQAGYWIPLMSVADVDRSVDQVSRAGGDAVLKPFDLPGRGRVALVRDPQGAAFGIIRTIGGDPVDAKAPLNEWLWHEVWSQDVAASERFYKSLVGFTARQDDSEGLDYRFMSADGQPRMAVAQKPGDREGSTWAVYVRVADVAGMTKKAESLGATVLMAPRADVRNNTVAIITDPTGAGLVLQEWNQ